MMFDDFWWWLGHHRHSFSQSIVTESMVSYVSYGKILLRKSWKSMKIFEQSLSRALLRWDLWRRPRWWVSSPQWPWWSPLNLAKTAQWNWWNWWNWAVPECFQSSNIRSEQGSLVMSFNVPMFHITQPWSVLMVFFMATIFGDVQYSQNGTFTNPWWMIVNVRNPTKSSHFKGWLTEIGWIRGSISLIFFGFHMCFLKEIHLGSPRVQPWPKWKRLWSFRPHRWAALTRLATSSHYLGLSEMLG